LGLTRSRDPPLQTAEKLRCGIAVKFLIAARETYMQEQRKIARSRALKSAKLIHGNSSVFDCTVRDLTDVGARIEVPNTVGLPENLDLTFDGGHSVRQCRFVWRALNKAGVEFV
jgi:PilZ domain-containing protein